MNSGHSRRICVWAISSVCVKYILCWQTWMKYWISCDTFVVRSVEFRKSSVSLLVFALVEAVMSLMSPILWLYGTVPRFFPFNLFIACIVSGAHNFVDLQSEREWVENESVDKDYPQNFTLEVHCCNHQYLLSTSSQNIVFVPGELWRASRNRYVFAPYQFHMTFLGFVESVRRRSEEHSRTATKIQCL